MRTRVLQLIASSLLFCAVFYINCYSEEATKNNDFEGWLGAEIDVKEAFNDARYVYEGLILKVQTNIPPPFHKSIRLTVQPDKNFKRTTYDTIKVGTPAAVKRDDLVIPEINDRVIIFTGRLGMVIHEYTVFKLLPATDETRKRMRSLAEEAGPIEEWWLGEEISAREAFNNAGAVFEASVTYCVEHLDRWRGIPPMLYFLRAEIKECFKNHEEGERRFTLSVKRDHRKATIPRRNQDIIIFTEPTRVNSVFKIMDAADETRALMRKLRDSKRGAPSPRVRDNDGQSE